MTRRPYHPSFQSYDVWGCLDPVASASLSISFLRDMIVVIPTGKGPCSEDGLDVPPSSSGHPLFSDYYFSHNKST